MAPNLMHLYAASTTPPQPPTMEELIEQLPAAVKVGVFANVVYGFCRGIRVAQRQNYSYMSVWARMWNYGRNFGLYTFTYGLSGFVATALFGDVGALVLLGMRAWELHEQLNRLEADAAVIRVRKSTETGSGKGAK